MKKKVNLVYVILSAVVLIVYLLFPMWIGGVVNQETQDISGMESLLVNKVPRTLTLGCSWLLVASLIAGIVQGCKNFRNQKLTKQMFFLPIGAAALYLLMVATSWQQFEVLGIKFLIKPYIITMIIMFVLLGALIYIPKFVIEEKNIEPKNDAAPATTPAIEGGDAEDVDNED